MIKLQRSCCFSEVDRLQCLLFPISLNNVVFSHAQCGLLGYLGLCAVCHATVVYELDQEFAVCLMVVKVLLLSKEVVVIR